MNRIAQHTPTHTNAIPGGNIHPKTTVIESFPAGAPRGSWPAEEFAAARRLEGILAHVVMNLATDSFNVVVKVEAA